MAVNASFQYLQEATDTSYVPPSQARTQIGRYTVLNAFDFTPEDRNEWGHLQDYMTDNDVVAVIRGLFPDAENNPNWFSKLPHIARQMAVPPYNQSLVEDLGYPIVLIPETEDTNRASHNEADNIIT